MRAALSLFHCDSVTSQFRFVVVVMPIRKGSVQGAKETQETSLVYDGCLRDETEIIRDSRCDFFYIVGLEASDVGKQDWRQGVH
jgi:hypothetical protein